MFYWRIVGDFLIIFMLISNYFAIFFQIFSLTEFLNFLNFFLKKSSLDNNGLFLKMNYSVKPKFIFTLFNI